MEFYTVTEKSEFLNSHYWDFMSSLDVASTKIERDAEEEQKFVIAIQAGPSAQVKRKRNEAKEILLSEHIEHVVSEMKETGCDVCKGNLSISKNLSVFSYILVYFSILFSQSNSYHMLRNAVKRRCEPQ